MDRDLLFEEWVARAVKTKNPTLQDAYKAGLEGQLLEIHSLKFSLIAYNKLIDEFCMSSRDDSNKEDWITKFRELKLKEER